MASRSAFAMACLLRTCALALVLCPAVASAQDDPRETAAAVLKAYAAADTRALQALGTETNRRIFGEIAAQGEAQVGRQARRAGRR